MKPNLPRAIRRLDASFRLIILALPIREAAALLYADTPEARKLAAWWEQEI